MLQSTSRIGRSICHYMMVLQTARTAKDCLPASHRKVLHVLELLTNWLQKLAKEVFKQHNALILTAANAKVALTLLPGKSCIVS